MMSRKTHQQLLGKRGEDLAADYLHKKGYRIIHRNFKARYGEIDIICIDRDTLVFVEVKTRIGTTFGTPEEAVTPRKLREVIQTAQYYRAINQHLPSAERIDVIALLFQDDESLEYMHHLQNVTG